MKRILLFILSVFLIFNVAFADKSENAKKYVEDLSSRVIALVQDKNINDAQKEDKLKIIFYDTMDLNWMAVEVMDKYWQEMDDAQKENYLNLYKKYLAQTYVPKFKDYNDQEIIIESVSPIKGDEYIVKTSIKTKDGSTISIDYKTVEQGDKFYVRDIIAEGVSVVVTQTSDFGSLISRRGVDTFLDKLEKKIK